MVFPFQARLCTLPVRFSRLRVARSSSWETLSPPSFAHTAEMFAARPCAEKHSARAMSIGKSFWPLVRKLNDTNDLSDRQRRSPGRHTFAILYSLLVLPLHVPKGQSPYVLIENITLQRKCYPCHKNV